MGGFFVRSFAAVYLWLGKVWGWVGSCITNLYHGGGSWLYDWLNLVWGMGSPGSLPRNK